MSDLQTRSFHVMQHDAFEFWRPFWPIVNALKRGAWLTPRHQSGHLCGTASDLLGAAARTALFAAMSFFVDGGPSTPLGFVFGNATTLVALLNMLGSAFLLSQYSLIYHHAASSIFLFRNGERAAEG
jgi:hypothetical protein